jgi:hypothetical protein
MHITILGVKILVNNKLSPGSRGVIVGKIFLLSLKFLFVQIQILHVTATLCFRAGLQKLC